MGSTRKYDAGGSLIEDRILTNEQTFDSVLASMVNKLERYVIPLVNEVFGKQYSEKAKLEIRNNKHIIRCPDGSLKRRESDAFVKLSEAEEQVYEKMPEAERQAYVKISETEEQAHGKMPESEKRVSTREGAYHFECETRYDRSIVLRIAEYSSVIAQENAEGKKDGVILNYPDSAVIFLRPGRQIPKVLRLTHRAQDGDEISCEIPTLQVADYGVEELFKKELLILLPFYLFRYVGRLEQMEKDPDKSSEMEESLGEICRRLEGMAETGEITVYQQRTILDLLLRVSDRLTVGFEKLREGVNRIMRGYVLRTEADDILDQGRAEDQREMSGLMNYLLTNNRSGDALRATTDRDYLNELLSQFRQGLMPVKQ